MSVKKILYNAASKITDATPLILSGLACLGVVGVTGVTAVESVKAYKEVKAEEKKKGRKLETKELVNIVYPHAKPVVIMDGCIMACILGSAYLSHREVLSLMAGAKTLDNYITNYRREVIEQYGKEADEKIDRLVMARDYYSFHQLGMDHPDIIATFVEPITGKSITCYEREIMDAFYHINRNYILNCGSINIPWYCDILGVPLNEEEEEKYKDIGWCNGYDEGMYWIDAWFENTGNYDENGFPIFNICYLFDPWNLDEEYI